MNKEGVRRVLIESLYYCIIGYFIVTIISSLHFLINWKLRGQEGFDETLGIKALYINATKLQAFQTTKPYHPLYNLVVFPIVAICMKTRLIETYSLRLAIEIGFIWLMIGIIFDVIFWLVIPHPWKMKPKELFYDFQPWLTFAYLVIVLSPLVAYWIH